MIGSLINHLWQSTVFAAVAGLLALALRKNRAQVRYWVWFSASVKFLVPFAVLLSLGAHFRLAPAAKKLAAPTPRVSIVMEEIALPFPEAMPVTKETRDWRPITIFGVWACGLFTIALMRFRGWLGIRAVVRASVPVEIPAGVEVRSSPGLLEPGVVGFLRPILLLPEGIAERLTPPQLEAVLAHELCHVRHRDNLFAAMHMMVEAMFWFHPLAWWIGARLVEERERACDEEVLVQGSEPRDYAEGILNVCKLYVESPLACVSRVTGSNIKKRIEAIMTNRIVVRLNFGKKLSLAVAGIAALVLPIAVGMMNAPAVMLGQAGVKSQPPAPSPSIASPTIASSEISVAPVNPSRTQSRAPQLIAQVQAKVQTQAQSAPLQGARGVAEAQAKFGEPGSPMARMYMRYGRPEEIEVQPSGTQLWRYKYLEDFHSDVEFEFAPGKAMQITWPPPVTYEGEPGGGEIRFPGAPEPVKIIAGLPGGHATMQVYPAKEYRMLSVPLNSLSPGRVDVVGQINTRLDSGAKGPVVANVQDSVNLIRVPPGMSTYTAQFTLEAGSYVFGLIVRDGSGQTYGETINFEAK